LAVVLAALMVALGRPAAAFETRAREALLIDTTTGSVLLDKDSTDPCRRPR